MPYVTTVEQAGIEKGLRQGVKQGEAIILLALLGFFQLGVPCMLMVVASRRLTAPELSLLALLEVLQGPLWAWLFAGETPTTATLGGGAVVLGALVFNELARGKRPTDEGRPA